MPHLFIIYFCLGSTVMAVHGHWLWTWCCVLFVCFEKWCTPRVGDLEGPGKFSGRGDGFPGGAVSGLLGISWLVRSPTSHQMQ